MTRRTIARRRRHEHASDNYNTETSTDTDDHDSTVSRTVLLCGFDRRVRYCPGVIVWLLRPVGVPDAQSFALFDAHRSGWTARNHTRCDPVCAKPDDGRADVVIEQQDREIERLRDDLARRKGVHREKDRLQRRNDGLQRQNERLRRENEHLKKPLAAERRAGRRQAAPFAKDRPQARGGRPGRRPGARHGRQGCLPRPARVDETCAAPAPATCPDCGGAVAATGVAMQYQHLLRIGFGLHVTLAGLQHLLYRAARDARPAYDALCDLDRPMSHCVLQTALALCNDTSFRLASMCPVPLHACVC